MHLNQLDISEVVALIKTGCGLTLDAGSMNAEELKTVAMIAHASKARIRIINAANLSFRELMKIAEAGQHSVSFD